MCSFPNCLMYLMCDMQLGCLRRACRASQPLPSVSAADAAERAISGGCTAARGGQSAVDGSAVAPRADCAVC